MVGGLLGFTALQWVTMRLNDIIVGGKHPVHYLLYAVFTMEMAITAGAVFNLLGLFIHARLWRLDLPPGYDPGFSSDKFGLLVGCSEERAKRARELLTGAGAEQVRVLIRNPPPLRPVPNRGGAPPAPTT